MSSQHLRIWLSITIIPACNTKCLPCVNNTISDMLITCLKSWWQAHGIVSIRGIIFIVSFYDIFKLLCPFNPLFFQCRAKSLMYILVLHFSFYSFFLATLQYYTKCSHSEGSLGKKSHSLGLSSHAACGLNILPLTYYITDFYSTWSSTYCMGLFISTKLSLTLQCHSNLFSWYEWSPYYQHYVLKSWIESWHLVCERPLDTAWILWEEIAVQCRSEAVIPN